MTSEVAGEGTPAPAGIESSADSDPQQDSETFHGTRTPRDSDAPQDSGSPQKTETSQETASATASGAGAAGQPAGEPTSTRSDPAGSGAGLEDHPAGEPPPAHPEPAAPGTVASRAITRRRVIAAFGGAAALAVGGTLLAAGDASVPGAYGYGLTGGGYPQGSSGYAPDGIAGRTAAFPLGSVQLLDSPFHDNQARNTTYLLFLDPDRMLHTFRLNYGLPSRVQPCGGWESPGYEVRGHTTGHLLSGLALTYANTGIAAAGEVGEYLVSELAALQALAPSAGYNSGYLSAFPEYYFDWLEQGKPVWSPYYMIHKYLAGMIDQYQLAGVGQALDVATALADWVDWRTSRLSYAQMQAILNVEFGGLPEALANLYSITGEERYLATAQRFYHAAFLDPLAAGEDLLDGAQANVSTPKIIACLRMWEETGSQKYHDIAENFWQIVTRHHSYVIGGSGNHEHWVAPDVIAAELSNYTCEGCVSYNMLKLTRLLYFHQQDRVDLMDYYERTLFNQMLGTQDPESPHGFNCYYTGLSAGAFKQQPLNYFPQGDPDVYSTDYNDFTCDNATGLETQAKFADTIYSRDASGVFVNLFIPSEVRCADQGVTLRQTTGFPDDPVVRITVVSGAAPMILRVRVPSWAAGTPRVRLNGDVIGNTVVPAAPATGMPAAAATGRATPAAPKGAAAAAGGAGAGAGAGGWVVVNRSWRPGDWLEVTFPMRLAFIPTPDQPSVQAVTYGPVVLSGAYGSDASTTLPLLDTATVRRTAAQPMTFEAVADGEPVRMIPVARARHQHFTVYWQTEPPEAATAPFTGT
jgi:uncharacterized protein